MGRFISLTQALLQICLPYDTYSAQVTDPDLRQSLPSLLRWRRVNMGMLFLVPGT
jgi:hypothetical protein